MIKTGWQSKPSPLSLYNDIWALQHKHLLPREVLMHDLCWSCMPCRSFRQMGLCTLLDAVRRSALRVYSLCKHLCPKLGRACLTSRPGIFGCVQVATEQ